MSGRHVPPRIDVVGVDEAARHRVEVTLGHGEDPALVLEERGWRVRRVVEAASRTEQGRHVLTVRYEVSAGPAQRRGMPAAPVRRDAGLVLAPGEVPEPHQRVAAYVLVTSERGLLLTELSDRTNAPGQWALPGGGIDPGEAPLDAVHREVWEETGQRVEVSALRAVRTSRWVGRAPGGRLEDFHAVRIVYRAVCPRPSEPVVHDVGGTTASAAWVALDEVARLRVTSWWRGLLPEAGVRLAPPDPPDQPT